MKVRVVPFLAVLALAGCSKIHETRPFTLGPMANNTLSISAPLSEQKIKVAVTADQPVNVWVLLEKDLPSGSRDDFDPDKSMKSGILATEKNTKDATLNATVPAKERFQIFVSNPGGKTAAVTVKVDSQ